MLEEAQERLSKIKMKEETETVGIIGPKRMDYENVMGTLKTLMDQLDDVFHK